MKNKDSIFFIGSVFNESIFNCGFQISPASNRWQKGITNGFLNNNINIINICSVPDRIFPLGRLCPVVDKSFFNFEKTYLVRYINLPFIRKISLGLNLFFKSLYLKKIYGNPIAIITYNPTFENSLCGFLLQKFFKFKWIDLCADHYDPKTNWINYNPLAKKSKAHIFLSYYAFKNAPFKNKYHFEGGIELKGKKKINDIKKFTVLYSGMMSEWGGLNTLLEAFMLIKKEHKFELWVCGHGYNKKLEESIKIDTRIKKFGFVSEKKLIELSNKASIFINPRGKDVNGNKMNFPSKILEYLSYCKPVISTWTYGLSPEYKKVLNVVDSDNPEDIADEIKKVFQWSNRKINYNNLIIKKFIKTKSWDIQTKNLIKWIKTK